MALHPDISAESRDLSPIHYLHRHNMIGTGVNQPACRARDREWRNPSVDGPHDSRRHPGETAPGPASTAGRIKAKKTDVGKYQTGDHDIMSSAKTNIETRSTSKRSRPVVVRSGRADASHGIASSPNAEKITVTPSVTVSRRHLRRENPPNRLATCH